MAQFGWLFGAAMVLKRSDGEPDRDNVGGVTGLLALDTIQRVLDGRHRRTQTGLVAGSEPFFEHLESGPGSDSGGRFAERRHDPLDRIGDEIRSPVRCLRSESGLRRDCGYR
jgi:hypothetical protein